MAKHKHVPDPDQPTAEEQAQADRQAQLDKRQAAIDAGNIPQASSAPLHNYPDAQMPVDESGDQPVKPKQPQSGTAATSQQHAGDEDPDA